MVLSGLIPDGAPERVVHGVKAELTLTTGVESHGGRRPGWGHQGCVCGILSVLH